MMALNENGVSFKSSDTDGGCAATEANFPVSCIRASNSFARGPMIKARSKFRLISCNLSSNSSLTRASSKPTASPLARD